MYHPNTVESTTTTSHHHTQHTHTHSSSIHQFIYRWDYLSWFSYVILFLEKKIFYFVLLLVLYIHILSYVCQYLLLTYLYRLVLLELVFHIAPIYLANKKSKFITVFRANYIISCNLSTYIWLLWIWHLFTSLHPHMFVKVDSAQPKPQRKRVLFVSPFFYEVQNSLQLTWVDCWNLHSCSNLPGLSALVVFCLTFNRSHTRSLFFHLCFMHHS